jgi:hypothetical protein
MGNITFISQKMTTTIPTIPLSLLSAKQYKHRGIGLILMLISLVSALVMTEMFKIFEANWQNNGEQDNNVNLPSQPLLTHPSQFKRDTVTVTVSLG